MLNVAHATNDVKWRPIVTTFDTLIDNMSRTGMYDWRFSMAQFLWYDCTFKKQMYRPCDLDLWQSIFFQWIDNDPISALYEFQIDISTNSWEIKYQNMGIGLYMLNVAHVKNDVKWRPIVTKFGTLIENMSRTGLYDCHIF